MIHSVVREAISDTVPLSKALKEVKSLPVGTSWQVGKSKDVM